MTITSHMIGDWMRPCKNKFINLSGRPMSTTIIIDAKVIAETAIISAILVNGVLHSTLINRKIAVISDPTKLIATKNTKFEM